MKLYTYRFTRIDDNGNENSGYFVGDFYKHQEYAGMDGVVEHVVSACKEFDGLVEILNRTDIHWDKDGTGTDSHYIAFRKSEMLYKEPLTTDEFSLIADAIQKKYFS